MKGLLLHCRGDMGDTTTKNADPHIKLSKGISRGLGSLPLGL